MGATEKVLCNYIPDYEKKAKFLQETKWVADLCSDGKLELAKARSESFGRSGESYSEIYKAFVFFETMRDK